MKNRKILIISGLRVFPTKTGANVRTAGIARALSKLGYDVKIYTIAGRREDYRRNRNLYGSAAFTHVVENTGNALSEEVNLGLGYGITQAAFRVVGLPRAWMYLALSNGLIPTRLKQELNCADIVISDFPWCPRIPGAWKSKPWMLISHNLEHRLLSLGDSRYRAFSGWMQRIEAACPRLYDEIFTCSDEDRDFFASQAGAESLKLPMIRCGVDPADYVADLDTREKIRADLGVQPGERLLVFSGSRYKPNLDAFNWMQEFCRAEEDFMKKNGLKMLVAGSVAHSPFRNGSLIATGPVHSIAPYLSASDGGLNPVTQGSGANIKMFEYLAARLPIISTSFGVRGTELMPERDFLPYEPIELKSVLENYSSVSAEKWRTFAEQVWTRHKSSCDINELVKSAVSQTPAFS